MKGIICGTYVYMCMYMKDRNKSNPIQTPISLSELNCDPTRRVMKRRGASGVVFREQEIMKAEAQKLARDLEKFLRTRVPFTGAQ